MGGNLQADETLLFLHIPKAAGTTLARIAERQIPASRQYRLGGNAQAAIEHFNQLPEAKRARYRYIAGHFPYGVHEQVPGPAVYLTFLRDPLERTASFYRFVRKQPDHPITQAMTPSQRESLPEFLKSCREPVFDNGQTRQLAGDWGHLPFGECDEQLLERAIQNLERIEVVGLAEQFIPSLLLAAERFGWNRIGFHSLNRTPGPPEELECPETRQALREVNAFDLQLYDIAKERFQRDCAALGEAFQEKVARFALDHPPPPLWRERLDRLRTRSATDILHAVQRKLKKS